MSSGVLVLLGLALVPINFFIISLVAFRKPPAGFALVRSGVGGIRVAFSGIFVLPLLHRAELVDMRVKTVDVELFGPDAVVFKDGVRADILVRVELRVNQTVDSVLQVHSAFGASDTFDEVQFKQARTAQFAAAARLAVNMVEFSEAGSMELKVMIIEKVGRDLNGFVLEDVSVVHCRKNTSIFAEHGLDLEYREGLLVWHRVRNVEIMRSDEPDSVVLKAHV